MGCDSGRGCGGTPGDEELPLALRASEIDGNGGMGKCGIEPRDGPKRME